MLTSRRLRELLHYDPRTGRFTWRVIGSGPYVRPGKIAGAIRRDGRRVIRIDQTLYLASRLAVLWVVGRWPLRTVDHKNGNPADDRWRNLRDATYSQNGGNQHAQKNKMYSQLKGVTCDKRDGVYQAGIMIDQHRIHLGRFPTARAAHCAYVAAARKHFGEFARAR